MGAEAPPELGTRSPSPRAPPLAGEGCGYPQHAWVCTTLNPPHGGSTPIFGAGDASWSDTVGHTPGRGWVQGPGSQNQTRSWEHNRGHGLCAQIPPRWHLTANIYKTPKFPFYGSDCPKSWLCCCWQAGAPLWVGSAPEGGGGQQHPDCVRSGSQRHQAASHRGAVELWGLAPKRPCQKR